MIKIIVATGHRPDKLTQKTDCYSDEILLKLIELAEEQIDKFKPTHVITGMALGWDTAVAIAALKQRCKLIAAVPFQGQEKTWPILAQERYNRLLKLSSKVKIVSTGGYSAAKMQRRNEWMINQLDKQQGLVLALWNGMSGGTKNAIDYARTKKVKIVNCWQQWLTKLN